MAQAMAAGEWLASVSASLCTDGILYSIVSTTLNKQQLQQQLNHRRRLTHQVSKISHTDNPTLSSRNMPPQHHTTKGSHRIRILSPKYPNSKAIRTRGQVHSPNIHSKCLLSSLMLSPDLPMGPSNHSSSTARRPATIPQLVLLRPNVLALMATIPSLRDPIRLAPLFSSRALLSKVPMHRTGGQVLLMPVMLNLPW